VTGPVWLALARSGNQFSAFYSFDDMNWTQIGSTQTASIGITAVAGLAVTSHDVNQLATGIFRSVGFQAGPSTALGRA
jgi:hypothetical protein